MTETQQIIRFEPTSNSVRLEAFGIGDFCKQFARYAGYTYTVNEKAYYLNQINGCRLNSLILALNHILDISIETFLDCFGVTDFIKCDTEILRKFDFTVQGQLEEFLKATNAPDLPRPKSKRPKTRLAFRSKKKSVVKIKKSKLKKSKKINNE
jgi:hypothetical protein